MLPKACVMKAMTAQGKTANSQWRKVSCALSYVEHIGS